MTNKNNEESSTPIFTTRQILQTRIVPKAAGAERQANACARHGTRRKRLLSYLCRDRAAEQAMRRSSRARLDGGWDQ
jgi:hypothetical protein